LIGALVGALILFYCTKLYNSQILDKNSSVIFFLRFALLGSLILSFFVFLVIFYFYLQAVTLVTHLDAIHYLTNTTPGELPPSSYGMGMDFVWDFFNFFDCSFDLFGLIFLLLAYLVGIISFLTIDTKLFATNVKYVFVCNIIVLVVAFFVITNDILVFFLLYEFLLVPSFFFVYFVGSYERATQAALYFVI
jgi:formate hydrogenlyase subunit 3/multisubunit Na+/H+ antiporter MnhD subunit